MNNIQYNYSHYPTNDLQPILKQRLQNTKFVNFVNFTKLLKKTKLQDKFELPDRTELKSTEMKKTDRFLFPQTSPIHKLSMMPMLWNNSIDQFH